MYSLSHLQLYFHLDDRNYKFLLESQIHSITPSMFYSIPSQYHFPMILMPTTHQQNPNILHLLSSALEKSLKKYQHSFLKQRQEELRKEEVVQVEIKEKDVGEKRQRSSKSELSSKQSEKISENQSQKIVSEALPNEPTIKIRQDGNGLSHEDRSQNMITLPEFFLPIEQRHKKIASLLQRRVSQWKFEKPRRRSTKIAYSWY